MSLEIAAKHLASKGRGPDTQLVHMSLGELNSLQELAKAHGGSLSINPDTGLPEAGFLSSILPMVAGAALSFVPGVGPLMAAGLVGGGTALATGNLNRGLMAGLGAFGGAGLGAGLANLGTGAISQAAGAGLGEEAAQQAIANKLAQTTVTDQLAAGAKYAFENPMNALKGIGGGSAMKGLGTIGMAAAPMMMGAEEQYNPPGIKPTAPPTPLQYSANPVSPTPQADVPGYGSLGQDFGRQQRYFDHRFTPVPAPAAAPVAPVTSMPSFSDYGSGMAAGGPVEAMSAANVYDMQNARGGVSDMGVDMSTGMQRMARGGISDLGDYSDGGRLLRGPGDGVSDSIPAVIGRKRPARLADGEFVVPARIVSELGNGSTEAGARKLYAMMNRVQRARGKTTGKGKVAKNTRAEKYLPA
jgi:hypothetical protein